jgi:hypothetical protein
VLDLPCLCSQKSASRWSDVIRGMPIETLDGTPGKEEQMTAQDPAPQTAHDLPASRPKASPESVIANPFARFFGGPPLAVIVA